MWRQKQQQAIAAKKIQTVWRMHHAQRKYKEKRAFLYNPSPPNIFTHLVQHPLLYCPDPPPPRLRFRSLVLRFVLLGSRVPQ
jgi:hypothetical protein